MKAVRVHAPGGPEALSYEDVPEPSPGPGDALVRIDAAGVNFIDVYMRSGQYKLAPGAVLGQEAAGTVVAVGAQVRGIGVGDRVAYAGVTGAYAELAAVPAHRLVRLPEGVTSRQAAALMLQGMTAHYLAFSTFPLGEGHACLIHAGAGGVGLLLCQIAKRRGAGVLATAGTDEKAALARQAGADETIVYTRQPFAPEVRRLTWGRGVDVVYDSVGQATFQGSLDSLAPRGLLALFGQSSGPVPPFDPQILNQKGGLFITRPALGQYTATADELRWRGGDVLGWVADGSLRLRVYAELPLREAAEAHRQLQGRQTTGKLLLVP